MARRVILELISALIAVKSILAKVRLKLGQSRSMGPSWRVGDKTLHVKLVADMAWRSASTSQDVRQ